MDIDTAIMEAARKVEVKREQREVFSGFVSVTHWLCVSTHWLQ